MQTETQGAGNGSTDYPDDIMAIGDQIANLTLIQAVELSTYLKEVHGIEAAGGVPQFVPQEQQKEVEKVVEKTEFDVILDGYEDSKKIGVIKVYRELTGLGIKEAKDYVEGNVGKPIKQGIPKVEAESIKAKLEQAGAKVSIR